MSGGDHALVVPSRGRPGNIRELLDQAGRVTTALTRMFVVVDDDDPFLAQYQELAYGDHAELVVRSEPRRLGPILNAVTLPLARQYSFVGFMGDDHRPRTPGWDAELLKMLREPGVAYGNDQLQGRNLPTACIVSSPLIVTLGYMSPPPCVHLFLDNFWKLLGETAGNLAYRDDVVVEHCHPASRKAEWDDGYRVTMSAELMSADRRRYEDFLAGPWPADRRRLLAYLDESRGAYGMAPGHG